MNQVIIFPNSNGGVSVCTPTGEVPIEVVLANDIPVGVERYVVEAQSLPETEYDFFDAWELHNGVVSVNLTKAKEIAKNRMRIQREPLLSAQDLLFMRAIETGQDTSGIVAEKQRLRDITQLVDTCKNTDELRSIIMSIK